MLPNYSMKPADVSSDMDFLVYVLIHAPIEQQELQEKFVDSNIISLRTLQRWLKYFRDKGFIVVNSKEKYHDLGTIDVNMEFWGSILDKNKNNLRDGDGV